jgi:CubicO group peptidase (beta-lactamase class C family)
MQRVASLDAAVDEILRAARIPGAAIAAVADGRIIYARGFGWRDLKTRKPVTPNTVYPIASTTKAINATLLGMLVDEGRLDWDAPVQRYLPGFRLSDASISSRVTIRDLVTMRTGLPRHDWVWFASPITRAELAERFAHLDLSADFRHRFQYTNLTPTLAGHIAEIVTGKTWETLARQRIFRPLGMRRTGTVGSALGDITTCYYENARRRLLVTRPRPSPAAAPAGSVVRSTVADMARWVAFNLKTGVVGQRRLIDVKTLREIHAAQVVIGDRSLARLPEGGAYAMGWVVDSYQGHRRVSHGGNFDDVNSSVMFFPSLGIGAVSFINFGAPQLAELLCQYAVDLMLGRPHTQTVDEKLAQYEAKFKEMTEQCASVQRVAGTRPSHAIGAYVGKYWHAGYGEIVIRRRGHQLYLQRHSLRLPLRHLHYDAWIVQDAEMWSISTAFNFDTGADGTITGLSARLDPETAPIRFVRSHASSR